MKIFKLHLTETIRLEATDAIPVHYLSKLNLQQD